MSGIRSVLFHEMPVDLLCSPQHLVEREMFCDVGLCCSAEAMACGRIGQSEHALRQGLCITRRGQKASYSVTYLRRQRTHRSRDDWPTMRHRLEHGEGTSLASRRHHEDIRSAECGRGIRKEAGVGHASCQSQLLDTVLEEKA